MAFSFLPRWRQRLSRHPACIGLDIAASTVRAAAVRRHGGANRIEAMAGDHTERSPGLSEDGHLGELEPLVDLCRQLISKVGRTGSLSMAIPLHATTSVRLTLPSSSTAPQRLRQIRAELAIYLPYPIDEAFFDFYVLTPPPGDPSAHPDDEEIVAVAVPQSMIDERLALADALQLPVSAIGIDAWMAVESTGTCPRSRHTAILHAGRESAWLALPGEPPALLGQHSHSALLKDIAGQIKIWVDARRLQRIVVCGNDPALASLAGALRKYAGIPAILGGVPASFQRPAKMQHEELAGFHSALSIAAGGLI